MEVEKGQQAGLQLFTSGLSALGFRQVVLC